MKCKVCKNTIPDGSIFCNLCGTKQIREPRKKKTEVSVPKPKQLDSGKWFIKMMVQGEYYFVTADTEAQCIKEAKQKKEAVLSGALKEARYTLGQIMDSYIAANEAVLSPCTIMGYDIIRRNRFQKYLNTRVCDIKDWQMVIDDEIPLCSSKTLKNAWSFVATALKAAGEPVPTVKLPQVQKSQRPYFTPAEIKQFVKAVQGRTVEIAALLGLHSLRRSEICALTWDNVDLSKKTITVKSAAVPDKERNLVYRDATKTLASQRTIPIMIPELLTALEAVDDKQGLVVRTNPTNIYKRINQICREQNLPEVGVHGLRHSFASLGYHLQIPAEIICKWGGWSEMKTVTDIYLHLYEEDLESNKDKMVAFFDPSKAEEQNQKEGA